MIQIAGDLNRVLIVASLEKIGSIIKCWSKATDKEKIS